MDTEQKRGFRGTWCPAELWDYFRDKKINRLEFMLLALVDSYVESKGGDCFAGLATLADRLGVSETEVSKSVSHLKSEGYLIQTKFDGRKRHMHAFWSRPKPKAEPQGRVGENPNPDPKPQGWVGENPKAGLGKIPTIDTSLDTHTLSRPLKRDGTDREGPLEVGKFVVNTSTTLPKPVIAKPPKTQELHPRWIRYATRLKEAIAKVHKVNHTSKINGWAKSLSLLHSQEGVSPSRIKKAMIWYCDHLPNRDRYTPHVESGAAFREKFGKVEAAMAREARDNEDGDSEDQGPPVKTTIVEDDGSGTDIYADW